MYKTDHYQSGVSSGGVQDGRDVVARAENHEEQRALVGEQRKQLRVDRVAAHVVEADRNAVLSGRLPATDLAESRDLFIF